MTCGSRSFCWQACRYSRSAPSVRRALADEDAQRRACGLGDGRASDLVAELIHATRRTDLAPRTAGILEEINFGLTVERQAAPASTLRAQVIKDFVATRGRRDLPQSDRPRVDQGNGESRAVFAHRPGADRADELPAQPRPVAAEYWSDRVFSRGARFVATAREGVGGRIGIEQNLALGEILAGLKARRIT